MMYIGIIFAGLVGLLIGWLWRGRDISRRDIEMARLQTEKDHATAALDGLKAEASEMRVQAEKARQAAAIAEERIRTMQEKLDHQKEEINALHEQLKLEFQNIANEILEKNTQNFESRSSKSLSDMLKPLGSDLDSFRKQVMDAYQNENSERASLKGEIRKLTELNSRISEEANNLTQALKGDSKMQGDWGEMILEDILEKSGLTEGQQYSFQDTLRDTSGQTILSDEGRRMRRDVVVRFPGNRHIIIDSKVSLTAFMDYMQADTAEEKKAALARHIASLRKHIEELSQVDYAKYDRESPDFVMMFIPNEPAYTLALGENPQLWNEAYAKKVVIMTPTNLVSALRLALDLWQRKDQEDHIAEIVKRGTALYDKIVGFCTTFDALGKSVDSLSKSYRTAQTQLTGNGGVTRQIELLRKTGIPSKKQLPSSMLPLAESDQSDDAPSLS